MSPNDPTPLPGPDAIRPDVRNVVSESPAVVPSEGAVTSGPVLVTPQLAEPSTPHPGFRWSVLWCLGFMIATQIPGAIIAAHHSHRRRLDKSSDGQGAQSSPEALLASPAMVVALAAAFLVTEILVIGLSLLAIRLVVGREWTRQLAVRLPSAAHVGFAVASLPGLIVLANAAYLLLRNGLPRIISRVTNVMGEWPWTSFLLVLGGSFLVIGVVVGRDWMKQRRLSPPTMAQFVLSLVLTAASVYIVLGIVATSVYLLMRSDMSDMMGRVMAIFGQWPWPFGVLIIGLGPGLGEELWCRGFLGRGLIGKHGVVLGVIFSSFFFGLIHLDACQGTMAMLMGLYLHFTYPGDALHCGCRCSLHFLNNSLAVVESRIPALKSLDADPSTAPLHLFAAAAVLLAVVIWALYASRARLAPRAIGALWRPTAPGVEYPPEGSGVAVVHPRPSALSIGLTLLALAVFLGSCYAVMSGK